MYSIAGANVWIMKLWPEDSSPALQVFHSSFGVGSLIAPLIGEPFFSSTTTMGSDYEPYSRTQEASKNSSDVTARKSQIQYPFAMVSAFHLILFLSMAALYFIDRSDFKPKLASEIENVPQNNPSEGVRFTRTLVGLTAVYTGVYVAHESTLGQMLTAYAVKSDLHLSKASAARLTATFFLWFTLSRVVAAFITIRVTSFQLLVVSHVILLGSSTALFIWGASSEAVLWTCTVFLGVAQGPMFAAVLAWTVSYVNMTNNLMSVIIVVAGVGSMAPSLLVGQFLDVSPNVFLHVCFVTVVLCVAVFAAMHVYVRKRPMLQPESAHQARMNVKKTEDAFSNYA